MLAEKIRQIVTATFEEVAFLDLSPGPAGGAEEPVYVWLEYSRPRRGGFLMTLPQEVCRLVASAIYGEEPGQLSVAQTDDSLLELLNILAGRLLFEHAGGSAYTMGLPTVRSAPPVPDFSGAGERQEFHVDSWPVTLDWFEVDRA